MCQNRSVCGGGRDGRTRGWCGAPPRRTNALRRARRLRCARAVEGVRASDRSCGNGYSVEERAYHPAQVFVQTAASRELLNGLPRELARLGVGILPTIDGGDRHGDLVSELFLSHAQLLPEAANQIASIVFHCTVLTLAPVMQGPCVGAEAATDVPPA